jgi:hypothetical protein
MRTMNRRRKRVLMISRLNRGSLKECPGSVRRAGRRYCLSLMMILTGVTPLFPEMPPREEIALWIGAESTFSHEEVTEMVEALMTIALEEIETASRETAREVAAEEAGKTAYYRDLAERERLKVQQLEQENKKLTRRCWILGGTSVGLGGLAGGVWLMNR